MPAIFGIRGTFKRRPCTTTEVLGVGLEIRAYGQTGAAEATVAVSRR